MQIRFNAVLSKYRSSIERAFALLKGRFRRLKYLYMVRLDLIPSAIIAACVLHNICLNYNDNKLEEYIAEGMEPGNEDVDEANRLFVEDIHDDEAGILRRDRLATQLATHRNRY